MASFITPYHFLYLFFFFPHLSASSVTHLCSHHEATSLIHFKNSFSIIKTEFTSFLCDDIAGLKSYPKTNSWKEGTDCCSWDGVTCDHLNAHVIALDLSCSWLYGNFPSNSTLFLLPHIQKLNIAYNDFNYSKMPSEFGQFTRLVYLNISETLFAGKVPSQISHSSKLVSLDLSHNGSILISLGNLLQLTYLDLSWNQLSGEVPLSILSLTQLQHLRIAENSLKGPIPDEKAAFPNLISLDLSNNLLNGKLPSWLYAASSLMEISLSQNQFSGHIRQFQSKSLEMIVLGNNKLQGPLPSSIFQFLNLTWLLLYLNNLSGVIEFGMFSNLPNLEYLDLSLNSLSLSSNNVSQFSPFLRGLKKLKTLDLSNNRIEGKIPQWLQEWNYSTSFGNLSNNLEFLNLKKNKSLEVLDLGNNKINDTFPHWLGSLPRLQVLVLNYSIGIVMKGQDIALNKIFVMWAIIDLSNSKFDGEFPKVIGKLRSLKRLNLSYNSLNGCIPTLIGSLTNLEWLDLFSNKLVGRIPRELLNLTALSMLNLSMNELVGCIPQGKQFNTFGNTSYEGIKRLHGFLLSSDCNNNELPPPLPPSNLSEE
ncbi:hypothetical protein V6Z11_A04G007400, partial [Gossypium hirsutum]